MKDNDTTITQLVDLVEELHKHVLRLESFEDTHIRANTLMKIATDYNHLLNAAFTDLKETLKTYENSKLSEQFNDTENERKSPDIIQILKKIEQLSIIIKDIRKCFRTVNYLIP